MEKHKILVVEDKHAIREGIVDILEFEGYNVDAAINGEEGLNKAKDVLPDLILSDISMPRLDGYELLQALKLCPTTFMIPFIYLSGYSEISYLRKGLNLGADDFLLKPCQPDELILAVKNRLNKHAEYKSHLNEIRTNISAALPHELRTPLNAILGFAQLLKNKNMDIDLDTRLEMGEAIYKSGKALLEMSENHILYAELELASYLSDKIKLYRQAAPVQLNHIVELVVFEKRLTGNRCIELQLEHVSMPIDEKLFQKLVEELLDNAIKFSDPDTAIDIFLVKNDDQITLSFKNRGRGMTMDEIKNIALYNQFNRKRFEQQGAGLGLAIVNKIVEIYNGILQIESIPDEATTVKVCFA